MRYNHINKEFRTDEVQQYLRRAAIARSVVGALLVAGIAFLTLSSPPSGAERLVEAPSQATKR